MAKKKDRKARRESRRSGKEILQYEAGAGSKAKLADTLTKSGVYKSKSAARAAIDAAEKGKRLPEAARQALKQQVSRADAQTAQRYAKEVKAPRAERARTTTTRAMAKRRAIDELKELSTNDSQQRQLEKARKSAKRVFDVNDGVVQYGKRSHDAENVRVIGVVSNYHNVAGPQTKIYVIPLWEMGYVRHEDRMKRMTGAIPNWDELTTAHARAEAIAEAFHELTGGTGTLKAFEYVTKEDLSNEQKGTHKKKK